MVKIRSSIQSVSTFDQVKGTVHSLTGQWYCSSTRFSSACTSPRFCSQPPSPNSQPPSPTGTAIATTCSFLSHPRPPSHKAPSCSPSTNPKSSSGQMPCK
ncbi:hypothetical protein Droror1_Dr00020528 [Drosera rotundifolia]